MGDDGHDPSGKPRQRRGETAGTQGQIETQGALIWSVFANREQAGEVARQLVETGLVSCANIMPGIVSIFQWQGTIEQSEEYAVLFKTDVTRVTQAIEQIEQLHPYETPVIMGWSCQHIGAATKQWLDSTGCRGC